MMAVCGFAHKAIVLLLSHSFVWYISSGSVLRLTKSDKRPGCFHHPGRVLFLLAYFRHKSPHTVSHKSTQYSLLKELSWDTMALRSASWSV